MPIVRERQRQRQDRLRAVEFVRVRRHQRIARVQAADVPHKDCHGRIDEGQARAGDGGRQRSFDRLGHRQDTGRPRRRTRLHYQGEALGRRVKPLAESVGARWSLPCDVEDIASVDAVFAELKKKWGAMDFLVHAIGFSDKNELKGRYADTTRENFERTMVISCFSFTEVAKRAAALMPDGGSDDHADLQWRSTAPCRTTTSWAGQGRVGGVGALSRGRFRAARYPRQRDIGGPDPDARRRRHQRRALHVCVPAAPLAAAAAACRWRSSAASALYLLSELSGGVTGEIHFVDSGYNIIAMPQPDLLRSEADETKDAAQ